MKLAEQLVSKKLAIDILALGVRFESLYAYYGNAGNWHDAIVDVDHYSDADEDFKRCKLLPAYSAAEIASILPTSINVKGKMYFLTMERDGMVYKDDYWKIGYLDDDGFCSHDDGEFFEENMANGLAMILIFLLKKKVLIKHQLKLY